MCAGCWRAVRPITPPICDGCGDPLPGWRTISLERVRCPRCRRAPRAVDRGRAIGPYDGALRAIIHALKYDGRRSLAAPLAAMMSRRGAELLNGADCVVPVPLHPSRVRERGFNQARELAEHIPLPLCDALRRTRRTLPQTALPAGRRHRNVRSAFSIDERPWPLGPRRRWRARLESTCVLLVDDVSTTGATLEACARALKDAGVREVRALTAARVVRRQP